jgi:hypothetical protein
MRYIKVVWLHDHPDEPIELYSELDDESWEVRKIERFRDGFLGYVGADGATERTRLGLVPVPSVDEIARDPEFQAAEIGREEFEMAWISACLAAPDRLADPEGRIVNERSIA